VPGAFRVKPTDTFTCGAVAAPPGSSDVFINGVPAVRMGDLATHNQGPVVPIDTASATVFVNNVGIVRVKGGQFPGDHIPPHLINPLVRDPADSYAAVGSTDVFVDDGPNAALFINAIDEGQMQEVAVHADYVALVPEVNPTANYRLAATTFTDDEESDNSQGLAVYPPPPAGEVPKPAFVITSRAIGIPQGATPPPSLEVAPPPSGNPPPFYITDCSDIMSHVGSFPGTFQLSTHYQLKDVTTNTTVSNYAVRAQNGLTEKQIVCSLRLVCVNILEKLRELYPTKTFRVNSGFRHSAVTDTGKVSQHCMGQAVDVEFLNMTKDEKYIFARDFLQNDINFDQFIFETRGGPSTWYHFSFKGDNNRRSILTTAVPSHYQQGIHRIA
jgi:hypothetical protein